MYSSGGTQQTNAHQVTGSGTTNGSGNLGVTLTGSAIFSSAASYVCVASYASSQAPTTADLTVTISTGSSFTIKGANSTAVQFICVGN